tara:strand:+ start:239 stop:508 length:270 start_codon:yes stop_codon:yes gene_type:complete
MEIDKIFFKTIDDFNNSQNQFKIEKKEDYVIIGNGSTLDSLASVSFFSSLEKNILKNNNKEVDIVNSVFSINKDKITIKDLMFFLKNNI